MHTPGPWTCQGQNVLTDRPYPHWKVLAEVRIGTPKNWSDPEGEANARLIAAAPDLYEAAIGLLGELHRTGLADTPGDTMADLRNRCDEMESAIAKAGLPEWSKQ